MANKDFTPPATYNKDQYFEQVSSYDHSIPVYTSSNTGKIKNSQDELLSFLRHQPENPK